MQFRAFLMLSDGVLFLYVLVRTCPPDSYPISLVKVSTIHREDNLQMDSGPFPKLKEEKAGDILKQKVTQCQWSSYINSAQGYSVQFRAFLMPSDGALFLYVLVWTCPPDSYPISLVKVSTIHREDNLQMDSGPFPKLEEEKAVDILKQKVTQCQWSSYINSAQSYSMQFRAFLMPSNGALFLHVLVRTCPPDSYPISLVKVSTIHREDNLQIDAGLPTQKVKQCILYRSLERIYLSLLSFHRNGSRSLKCASVISTLFIHSKELQMLENKVV